MGKVSAKVSWQGGMKFQGRSEFGNTITVDSRKDKGGTEEGAKATEMLLFAVAGCTGIDVARILKKQRQDLDSLEIEVTGHQNEDYPKPFHTVEVKYIASGDHLDEKKLGKAIELSESKYCVVSQTLKNETKVVTSHEVQQKQSARSEKT